MLIELAEKLADTAASLADSTASVAQSAVDVAQAAVAVAGSPTPVPAPPSASAPQPVAPTGDVPGDVPGVVPAVAPPAVTLAPTAITPTPAAPVVVIRGADRAAAAAPTTPHGTHSRSADSASSNSTATTLTPAPNAAATDGADPVSTTACPTDPTGQPAGWSTSAAAEFGWGKPNQSDDFNAPLGQEWGLYDGVGHDGKGRRTPSAVSVHDGIMTITGDAHGNTDGMSWGDGEKYGRWEGRVRAPASDPSYNALLLLWPNAENWPVGGEVDFMEMSDHTRQNTDMFLHYGKDNAQLQGNVVIDATQWHNWAVEWTPDHIAAFVDGKEWWRTNNTKALPPGPMHLCIQLDWFPKGGSAKTSRMDVDWVRQYPLNG